jgi:hypothetical protein
MVTHLTIVFTSRTIRHASIADQQDHVRLLSRVDCWTWFGECFPHRGGVDQSERRAKFWGSAWLPRSSAPG